MILIKINSYVDLHLAVFAKLMGIDMICIKATEDLLHKDVIQTYYSSTLVKVGFLIYKGLRIDDLDTFFKRNCTIVTNHDAIEPTSNEFKTCYDFDIDMNEKTLLTYAHSIGELSLDLLHSQYLDVLMWTIQTFYKRSVTRTEIEFFARSNVKYGVNLFEWLLILHYSDEGFARNLHKQLSFDSIVEPRVALLLYDCSKHFNKTGDSHKEFIDNPNIDIFIHSWKDNIKLNAQGTIWNATTYTDEIHIKEHYKPKRMMLESKIDFFDECMIESEVEQIYVMNEHTSDHTKEMASSYYSLQKVMQLMLEYEKAEDIMYDAVILLKMDYKVKSCDFVKILQDIQSPVLYFAGADTSFHKHWGGGGGCTLCDANVEHVVHGNDMCTVYMYGNRTMFDSLSNIYTNLTTFLKQHNQDRCTSLQEYTNTKYVNVKNTSLEDSALCIYPERLLRFYLKQMCCKSGNAIRGLYMS